MVLGSAKDPVGYTLELGGGGELGCFQFANTSFEAVNASAEDGEFGFEFFEKATQFVGDFSDAVETCVQQCCSLVTGHRPVAAESAVGVTSDAAVLLNQVAERLIGPVSWVNVGELGNAGDLVGGSRVVRNAVDVELGGIGAGGQKAQGGRSHQHLLEKLH